MDETYSESDVSLSPSQILERLQMLRQLQLLQRGKLQKQRLQYKETSENSSSITEIVSQFSNSTSYNTFRSLLQSTNDNSNEGTPRLNTSDLSHKVQERDLIEGVTVLNLSQESEFNLNSPVSSRSRASAPSRNQDLQDYKTPTSTSPQNASQKTSVSSSMNKNLVKKQISLDEMPILSPKQDFEALIIEKLENEKNVLKTKGRSNNNVSKTINNKKPFLRKGEGIARFGLGKNDFVIQNTKSLPWKRKSFQNKTESPLKLDLKKIKSKKHETEIVVNNGNDKVIKDDVQDSLKDTLITQPSILVTNIKHAPLTRKNQKPKMRLSNENQESEFTNKNTENEQQAVCEPASSNNTNIQAENKPIKRIEFPRNKHPLVVNKGKTWAAVLTKEQNDFLSQLKKSDYYKNFNSPTKSVISDVSCDETMTKLRNEREAAEQNMFELLENKVTHESFNLESSFFNRFLRSNLECSGESTPLVLQKCLSQNPDLRHILPEFKGKTRNENSNSDRTETCCSNYTDCCSDACSSVSCCSCKTVDETNNTPINHIDCKLQNKKGPVQRSKIVKINQKEDDNKECQNDTMTENDIMKANMAEMNAKLIATSELLKDRLCELEDEIETFRKENASLAKLREEVDQDRQKFYEEKAAFEHKFNEEKVLSEYYLAEEKEKLNKQKQMYERYVREMRGRLNKKDKDEVVNLKKEINDLKVEIRTKDAKSTSIIARLRNQIKLMEKEKKDLQEEVEKLKKQNRRIQHSNEVTRRLTNIKYLEEINKKLTNMSNKDTRSEVSVDRDVKYKAYEIERQCRSRKVEPVAKGTMRPRAKSVPNLNVTSRYAKYFSQRDTASHIEHDKLTSRGSLDNSDDGNFEAENDIASDKSLSDDDRIEDDNNLEKIYMERFKSTSPKSNRSSGSNSNFELNLMEIPNINENVKGFFIQKSSSASSRNSKSPRRTISPCFNKTETNIGRSKSPISILSNRPNSNKSPSSHNSVEYLSNNSGTNMSHNRSKSPISSINHSSLRSVTVIHNEQYRDKLLALSPEPAVSKTSFTKTSLNPSEVRKPDGSRELRFPNGNIKYISADGKYSKFMYYNGDVKENFYNEGRIKYFYAETKTYHTTHADGLEVLEFPDGQVEKRYKDGSSEIRLPNGSVRYFDPKNEHVREEWRFPDGAALTVAANGEQRIVFTNGQVEVHAKDHKRREFPDGTVKLVYNDGTSETRYASGRVRIKDKHGNLIMDSASG